MPNYHHNVLFQFESGAELSDFNIYYETYGTYIPGKSKVVWVCHALTANANVFEWWAGLFGMNDLFNPQAYFIVCVNNLGSCYGTTGPLSINKLTGNPHYHNFPEFTIRDMVQIHELLRRHLKIDQIFVLIGGSQGGQQALEWSILNPNLFHKLILIATNAVHSPWGIAFNETQRMAIALDKTFSNNNDKAGEEGLKTARAIALLSYRNYKTYKHTQSGKGDAGIPKVRTYQTYQGEKLANRFNAFSYWFLSLAMDSHDVGRNRDSTIAALKQISARTLIIGIKGDILFPIEEQQFLAGVIPNTIFKTIDSIYGHDGFLIETKALSVIINEFLN